MAPLALCNFVSYDLLEKSEAQGDEEEAAQAKKRCIVALDIGADNSNLVITDGQHIIWQRPIPLGGNHFTRALNKDMKLTFAKADHFKHHATKSPELKQILSSLKPVLNDFAGEVQRSLCYFTNTHRDANVQYMIGLGNAFRLPGMQRFLGEKLQIEVRKLQKLERLDGEGVITSSAYTENVLSFGVAYGLALQGLGVARLHTNLLPQDIQVDRCWPKKPWIVTAAELLLLATSVLRHGLSTSSSRMSAQTSSSSRLPTMPRRRTSLGLWVRLWNRVHAWLRAGKTARDRVDATVFAPPAVEPGHEFLVQVFAHLPTQGDQARELAREFDQQAERRAVTSLELEIACGERLTFHLTLPGLVIDSPQASLVWRGRPDSVQFGVRVPLSHAPGTVLGTVTASLHSVPVGHVKFKLTIASVTSPARPAEPAATGESAQLYRHAFISYASADRKEVLKRVQMLAWLRIRFSQDILHLDPGVRWQKQLYRHIDQSDLFLLFWSTPARQSKCVLEEVRYALKRKGDDDLAPPEILPIIIEGPPPPPPPDELAHLHFNDYLLYLMQEPNGPQS
jgi:hypothetical protein